MNSTDQRTAVVGQSGGPTAVINRSLVAVIRQARECRHITTLLGARYGVRGIINEDFIRLDTAPDSLLDRIAQTPAAALRSTRDKPDQAYCEKIFRTFAKNRVGYFFYIGGNDSAETARIVSELARAEDYPLQVFHIPKTIDNDLRVHDHTPGYGSAAKFVATAMIGDNFDNRSLPGIKVDVLMGRNAGYLTAAAALARLHDDDGPHLIYLPEQPLSEEKFLADVDQIYSKRGRCLVAVSEGVLKPDGKTWFEHLAERHELDMHGNLQLSGSGELGDYMADLIVKNLSPRGGKALRVRADTWGYIQRSFPGCVSQIDAIEARMVGEKAVEFSAKPGAEGSVAMRRVGTGGQYKIDYFLTPLDTVAKETRKMPREFYEESGNDVTQAFLDYARPLIGELPKTGTFDELTVGSSGKD
jgi:6-phosphofructokinase 1